MSDLTPEQLATIDEIVTRDNRERALAPELAARADHSAQRVAELWEENRELRAELDYVREALAGEMRRWWWNSPMSVTRPWLPRWFRATDEYCNPTFAVIIPLLGMVVVRYRPGKLRTTECHDCTQPHNH